MYVHKTTYALFTTCISIQTDNTNNDRDRHNRIDLEFCQAQQHTNGHAYGKPSPQIHIYSIVCVCVWVVGQSWLPMETIRVSYFHIEKFQLENLRKRLRKELMTFLFTPLPSNTQPSAYLGLDFSFYISHCGLLLGLPTTWTSKVKL